MITPTVGRICHYYPSDEHSAHAAIISRVHNDTCVDLTWFPVGGPPKFETSVTLTDDTDDSNRGGCWAWMPYQIKKHEEAGEGDRAGSESGEQEVGTQEI